MSAFFSPGLGSEPSPGGGPGGAPPRAQSPFPSTLPDLERAAETVYRLMPATPQFCWPLLSARAGCELWVKHENHTPIGAFKLRGGIVYLSELQRAEPGVTGVLAATRGNHGQSVAHVSRVLGLRAVIVVPHGNSREKNAAMRALGAELVEHGRDFQAANEFATGLAAERRLHLVPSFHPLLMLGAASYALELLRAVPALDTVYVPIGLGSGICGMIAARDALGLRTRIVGVVAERAPAYGWSFERGAPVSSESADTLADGVACRVPQPEALALILRGVDRIVAVPEGEIHGAMRHYFTDTHNVAEGAGALALAAVLQESATVKGKRIGVVLSGGNVDREVFAEALR